MLNIEEAWYAGETEAVRRAAEAELQVDPTAFAPKTWLGLASCHEGEVAAGHRSLRDAFASVRDARDDETEWLRHATCNRLVELVPEAEQLQVARFIVDELKVEHGTSLRLLAEHAAASNPIEALALARRAITADPADAEAHYLAAKFFAGLGKRALTLKHLELALEHGSGVLAVRSLARVDKEFDGLRSDAAFTSLVDPLPAPPLRALYASLDAGQMNEVVRLAATQPVSLDVLYPLREALERLIDAGEDHEERLAAVNADIDEREDAGEQSDAFSKYCGEL